MQQYWLCVVGRTIFGLGGESLTVAQNTFTVRWFSGDILAMVFGVVVAFSRIGSAINFALTPYLVSKFNIQEAVWIATSTCGISLLAVCIASYIDYRSTTRLESRRKQIIQSLPVHSRNFDLQHDALTDSSSVTNSTVSSSGGDGNGNGNGNNTSESVVSFSQIQYFPLEAWVSRQRCHIVLRTDSYENFMSTRKCN
jgi:MFS family permease